MLAAYRAAQTARASAEVCIVGKSLGTLGIHLLLSQEALPGARLVWLTPLLGRPEVQARILERAATLLVVIGTLDPHFSSDRVQELRSAGAELLVLEGAHHNLMVQGDTVASLRHLCRVMQAIRDFAASV
ncbi:hypothetical protein GCM10017783_17860 [Deinococcus piscis]|uniref:Alpha/beta hydrolase n=1 Tax=Deinococcus piscis TaxID=394230 RepID=A0ABQ3KB52_9DEIO|nr:hypothetical protein [Deinococcus piscis]GHG05717.1 hypothetical protein GCM10017783_17860 [Deinococcus piscis]